jgi:NIPSNAP
LEYELRRHRIKPGHLEEFLDAWLGGVVALRRRFGFVFGGAWIVEDTGELVWILGYDGLDGFDAADERYYSSAERAALDPDPAQWLESAVQERMRSILDPG